MFTCDKNIFMGKDVPDEYEYRTDPTSPNDLGRRRSHPSLPELATCIPRRLARIITPAMEEDWVPRRDRNYVLPLVIAHSAREAAGE